jgi:hypothetical protein
MGLLKDDLLKKLQDIARVEFERRNLITEGLENIKLTGLEGRLEEQVQQVVFANVAKEYLKGTPMEFREEYLRQAAIVSSLGRWMPNGSAEWLMLSLVVNNNNYADRHFISVGPTLAAELDVEKDTCGIYISMAPALEIETKIARLFAFDATSSGPDIISQYILHDAMRLPLNPLLKGIPYEDGIGYNAVAHYQDSGSPAVVMSLRIGLPKVMTALAELDGVKYEGPFGTGPKAVEQLAEALGGHRLERK